MTVSENLRDRTILGQVVVFLLLFLLGFAENGLGYFPALYGSVPKLSLIALFLLTIYQPASVSLVTIIIIGLLHDLTEASPLGYTAAAMLMVHFWATIRQPILLFGEGALIWYEFVLVMGIVLVFSLLVFIAFNFSLPAFQPMLFQYGLTIILFPILNWIYRMTAGFLAMLELDT